MCGLAGELYNKLVTENSQKMPLMDAYRILPIGHINREFGFGKFVYAYIDAILTAYKISVKDIMKIMRKEPGKKTVPATRKSLAV